MSLGNRGRSRGMEERKPYPSHVSDEEWAFATPYLALMREDAPQREHRLASRGRAGDHGGERGAGLRRPGCTGGGPAQDAAEHGIRPELVRLPDARRGFVLLPRRWVVERSFAWLARSGLRSPHGQALRRPEGPLCIAGSTSRRTKDT